MVVVQASLIYIYGGCTGFSSSSPCSSPHAPLWSQRALYPILLHRSVDIMGERGTRPPFQGDVQVMMGDTEMETGQTIRELMGERDTTGEHRGEVHTSSLWRRNAKCFLVDKLTNNYTN